MQGSPQVAQTVSSRQCTASPPGALDVVGEHVEVDSLAPSTGSISSWKPAEITVGRSARERVQPSRTSTCSTTHATTSSSGA